jgi:hypothetical protein
MTRTATTSRLDDHIYPTLMEAQVGEGVAAVHQVLHE